MMVMCSNHSSTVYISLCRQNPSKLGQIIGPTWYKAPRSDIPFALDNDAYSDFTKGKSFNYLAWVDMLNKVRALEAVPLWIAVPDVVANRQATLANWKRFSPVARCYGWPLAFVAQDGMTPRDVPKNADVVFVGGTTSWKWRTLPMWCEHFPRVHIGRVNNLEKVWICQRHGAESCDGSGWFRDSTEGGRARQLRAWLHHGNDPQRMLL
jgi:hypothetical protein